MKGGLKIVRLDHVQICVPVGAEEPAREFYTGVLGLAEIEKPLALRGRGGLWLRIADIELHIGVELLEGRSKRHPAFVVEQLDASREYLESRGVATQDEVPLPGLSRFSFFDPFGNRIEFLELI